MFKGNPNHLQQIVARAEAARREGHRDEAGKLLRQIVQIEPDDENRMALALGCLSLGEICDERNARAEAVHLYEKAQFLGADLTARAWIALAENFADEQAASEYALSAYLAYIERRPQDASSAKVYAALEAACRVDEDEIAVDRKRAFERNKRVIAVNNKLEWPHYYLGVAYLQEGDVPSAMMNLTRARKRNPDRAMTYYWMGACHLLQSGAGLDAAIEWLSKFVAFPPENRRLAELQGAAAFELGKRLMRAAAQGQAIPYLELAVARESASAPRQFRLGQAYFETGKLDSSFEALARACAIEPDFGEARELLAQVCLRGARYAEAAIQSRAALRLQGANPALTGYLIAALYAQDKFGGVVAAWEQTPTAEIGSEAVFFVARSYSRLGRFKAALACLEQLPPEPRVVFYSGCALANLGRMEEARPRFEEAARGDDEYATKALVELGTLFLRTGNTGEAGACYDRALERDPRNAVALYGMGSLAFRMGEMGVAADCFSKLLARREHDARAQFAMGAVSESRGDIAEAIRFYEAASKKLDLRLRLGVLYCRNAQYAESAQLLEPLYHSGAGSDTVSYYLGMALGYLNRGDEAIEVWSKLAERHPEDRELASGLAEMYFCRALFEWASRKAGGSLDQALVLDPKNVRCRYFRALYDWKGARHVAAANRLRDLAEQCGEDARILYHAGLRLLLNGEPEPALRYLARAARRRDSDYGRFASWAIANHYVGQRQYTKAEAVLGRDSTVRMTSELELRALEQRCGCLAALGKIPELENLLERYQQPCVRYYLALGYARNGALDRATEQVTMALARDPDNARLRDLEPRLEAAIPAALAKTGARREAAEIWERALAAQPDDFAAQHNLAVLTYWWAQQEESAGGPDADRLWMAAISYWTRVAASDPFWIEWQGVLSRRWGMALQESDLQPARETLLDERLIRVFKGYVGRYKEQGRFEDAARHDDYITATLVEQRPSGSFTGEMRRILGLIEDREMPEKALERLAALPEDIRQGPEAGYLRVRALLGSARGLLGKDLPTEALGLAEAAWAEAASLEPQWSAIQQEAGEMLDTLGRQEAARLQGEERIDEAIGLLERLNLREAALALYCDRGLQRLSEKRFEDGRADFQKALGFDPRYLRAKQAMAAAYYNEAIATEEPDAKIKLLQKALEYHPNNPDLRENLAAVFHEKAQRIVKETTPSGAKPDLARAIELLRAAATTLDHSISEETLDGIVRSGDCTEALKWVRGGRCRTALENLASAARNLKRVRSE